MRPTPRTDAFERARQKFSGEPDVLTMEYARTLERELAEAVEILQFIISHTDKKFWIDARAFLKRMEQK